MQDTEDLEYWGKERYVFPENRHFFGCALICIRRAAARAGTGAFKQKQVTIQRERVAQTQHIDAITQQELHNKQVFLKCNFSSQRKDFINHHLK